MRTVSSHYRGPKRFSCVGPVPRLAPCKGTACGKLTSEREFFFGPKMGPTAQCGTSTKRPTLAGSSASARAKMGPFCFGPRKGSAESLVTGDENCPHPVSEEPRRGGCDRATCY